MTCIKKGRVCRGEKVTNSRCEECHHDKLNEHAESRVDECHWGDTAFGIETWLDAELLFGLNDDNIAPLKRKLADGDDTAPPRKRNRKIKGNIDANSDSLTTQVMVSGLVKTRFGMLPAHLQIPASQMYAQGLLPLMPIKLEYRMHRGYRGPLIRETIVGTQQFKSVKAAIVYRMWSIIRNRELTSVFTNRPNYMFRLRDTKESQERLLTEEDFVQIDRDIRAGSQTYSKEEGFVFVCTATRPRREHQSLYRV